MTHETFLVDVPRSNIEFHAARVASSRSPVLPSAPLDDVGRQMALGVARVIHQGEPVVALTLVLGDTQTTLTLDASETNQLCHLLADAVLWQNEQLRLKAGHAVH